MIEARWAKARTDLHQIGAKALGAGLLGIAALQFPGAVLAKSAGGKPPIQSKQVCINVTLFNEGRAPTAQAARKAALQKWQAGVTSAWGASFANYAMAKNRSTKYSNLPKHGSMPESGASPATDGHRGFSFGSAALPPRGGVIRSLLSVDGRR